MELSEKQRKVFIKYAQQKLDEYASFYSQELLTEKRLAPFGKDEEQVVKAIEENPEGYKSYFEKVFWQCSQGVLFDLFCIIDGVADPDDPNWKGVLLIDKPERYNLDNAFLHDEL